MVLLKDDWLFLVDFGMWGIVWVFYDSICDLLIFSLYGYMDLCWFVEDQLFFDLVQFFVMFDYYVFWMLCLQGVVLIDLGVLCVDGGLIEIDGCKIWWLFVVYYYLFLGMFCQFWLDYSFQYVFGIDCWLNVEIVDWYYDYIVDCLSCFEFCFCVLFKCFNIEVIVIIEVVIDDLCWYWMICDSGWDGCVIIVYCFDVVIDFDMLGLVQNVELLGQQIGFDMLIWVGYLDVYCVWWVYFKEFGVIFLDYGYFLVWIEDMVQVDVVVLF